MPWLKMLFPLRRRPGVTHEQLVSYWREVHMPRVVAHLTPNRYSVTLFDQRPDTPFDGMASVTYDDPDRARREQGRRMPVEVADDGFGDLVEPASRLETTEHVIVDGPRPEGACKLTGLVAAGPGLSLAEGWRLWLDVHAPNVAKGFTDGGGLRYVVNLADQNRGEPPFLGAAELWFSDRDAARRHLAQVPPDEFLTVTKPLLLPGIEVIGIG
ncbi:MAG: EthD domain-containing protein [Acidimicrobiales bacterium]